MKITRTFFKRRQIKSSKGGFIWEFENSYELSLKLSSIILLSAKEYLVIEDSLQEGPIETIEIEKF